jgi:hypothetical protein
MFCDPRGDVAPDFVPNVDVVSGDAGWVGGAHAVLVGNGNVGQSRIGTVDVVSGFTSGVGDAVSGSTPAFAVSVGDSQKIYTFSSSQCAAGNGGAGAGGYAALSSGGGVAVYAVLACSDGTVPFSQSWYDRTTNTPPGQGAQPTITYLFRGNPSRPPDIDPDPLRRWETTVQCKQADGSTKDYTATSAEFRQTDETWPALPSITCPAGEVQSSAAVRELGGPSPIDVWSVDIPQNIQDAHTEFPQCVAGGCLLTLWSVSDTGVRTDCFSDVGACEDWLADPQRDVKFQCTYGLPEAPVDVALSECYIYGPSFNPQARGAGTPYGNPADGSVVPGTNVEVVPDGGTGGAPADVESGPCFPSGWSAFNPLEWVLMPVKCALTWAFVPEPQAMADAGTSLSSAFAGLGVAQWMDVFGRPIVPLIDGPGACTSWQEEIPLSADVHPTVTVLDPCTGIGAQIASASRMISGAIVVIGGCWAAFRAFSSIALNVDLAVGKASNDLKDLGRL